MNQYYYNKTFVPAPPRLDEQPSESWQAKKPQVEDINQLTLPYRKKLVEIIGDAVNDVRACRSLAQLERKSKISGIAIITLKKVQEIGLSEKEAITLLCQVIKTWKITGASPGSMVSFHEFKECISELSKTTSNSDETSN